MRTIKFRAWNKVNQKWYEWERLEVKANEGIWMFVHRYKDKSHPKGEAKLIYEWGDENLIKVQFTGLKDKNGKEIYEGDILKHNNIYKARFSLKQLVLLLADINKKTNWRSLEWLSRLEKYIEVIGNIHEHKDLLS